MSEEQQLRVRRIQKLCQDFINILGANGISAWEVVNPNGALKYLENEILMRPITEFNELGQPKYAAQEPAKTPLPGLKEEYAGPAAPTTETKEEPNDTSV